MRESLRKVLASKRSEHELEIRITIVSMSPVDNDVDQALLRSIVLGPMPPLQEAVTRLYPETGTTDSAQLPATALDAANQGVRGEVTLRLPIPPMPDDPEVRALVIERLKGVVHELSAAYIAAGGSGLVLKDAELHVESPVEVPVLGGGGR